MPAFIELTPAQYDAWFLERANHDFGNQDVRPVRYYNNWIVPVAAWNKNRFKPMKDALEGTGQNKGPLHPSNTNVVQISDADLQTYWESVVLAAESSAPLEAEDTSNNKNKKK